MERLKYIHKVAETYPYEYEQPPICKAELWNLSRANENDEARKEAVCLVASISYGNEYCKDPDKLWDLLIERGHESPFEFVREARWVLDSSTKKKYHLVLGNLRNRAILYSKEREEWCESVKREYHIEHYATFKLKVPIFVARQIQRHRAFSYMEMSRRYVKGDKVEFEFWKPPFIKHLPATFSIGAWEISGYSYEEIPVSYYNEALKDGLKPEQARAFLPLGLYTQFWMQGDYKVWLNFFIHRLHPETQEETRLVAQAMWNLLKEHQPEIVKTMANYLEKWTKDCNPMFTPARQKKAEWFRKNFLGGW